MVRYYIIGHAIFCYGLKYRIQQLIIEDKSWLYKKKFFIGLLPSRDNPTILFINVMVKYVVLVSKTDGLLVIIQ